MVIAFCFLITSCASSNDSSNEDDSTKEVYDKQKISSMSLHYNAVDWDAKFAKTEPFTIELQEFIDANIDRHFLFDYVYITDIYRKDGKTFAVFENYSATETYLIVELNDETKKLFSGYSSNDFSSYAAIIDIDSLTKPVLSVVVDSGNTEDAAIGLYSQGAVVIKGRLIDLYKKSN